VLAVLLIQMLPAEGLFIAQYKLMGTLGLLNTVVGVSILYIAAVVPFTIWMLRGFVAGIPADLEEAAMVDGLSRTQAFLRITFPLLAPGLVASGVYAFLQAWNEFTVALVILPQSSSATLPLWLRGFVQQSASRATDWGQVMAASTLVAVPVIIFFLIVQGRMTSGLVSGAVKG
jgi:N,N'-diacetylchitobiose transport system permease protein